LKRIDSVESRDCQRGVSSPRGKRGAVEKGGFSVSEPTEMGDDVQGGKSLRKPLMGEGGIPVTPTKKQAGG